MAVVMNHRPVSRVRRHRLLVAVFVAGLGCSTPASAADGGDLQSLVDELQAIVQDARAERSADRRFLDELQAFIDKHGRPWKRTVLSEDFSDGDHTRSPAWKTVSGQHRVDGRYGLVATPGRTASTGGGSQRSREAEVVNALLGALLKQGSGNSASRGNVASDATARLETSVSTANAFAVEARVSAMAAGARLTIGLAQGSDGDTGYRLVLEDGAAQPIRLELVIRERVATVATASGLRQDIDGGYNIAWTRNRAGAMEVTVNGSVFITATDRGLSDGFARLVVENSRAEVALRSVQVLTTL